MKNSKKKSTSKRENRRDIQTEGESLRKKNSEKFQSSQGWGGNILEFRTTQSSVLLNSRVSLPRNCASLQVRNKLNKTGRPSKKSVSNCSDINLAFPGESVPVHSDINPKKKYTLCLAWCPLQRKASERKNFSHQTRES